MAKLVGERIATWSRTQIRLTYSKYRTIGQKAFSPRYLLYTNVGISIGLSALGDTLQQQKKMHRGGAKAQDWTRTRDMAISGVSGGIICHYWYIWLDGRFPGKALRIVLRKVMYDQLFIPPVIWTAYLITLGVMEQSGVRKLRERLRNQLGWIYLADWLVWVPAQFVNFTFLPTRFRVLYDNVIALGFRWFVSYITHDFYDSLPEVDVPGLVLVDKEEKVRPTNTLGAAQMVTPMTLPQRAPKLSFQHN